MPNPVRRTNQKPPGQPKPDTRRIFFAGVFLLAAGCMVWFTNHPLRLKERRTADTQTTAAQNVRVPFYSMNLTANARANLSREYAAYNVSYAPQNYYTALGSILDAGGAVIYSTDTLPLSAPESSYEYHRNLLGMYLYGDRQSLSVPIMGPEALMRTAPAETEDFLTGSDMQTALRPALEREIYQLLRDNGITGGCIITDTMTGRIEVMAATSVAGVNTGGTELEALKLEKSGLSQLDACITPKALTDFGLTPEQYARYFDYQALSSEHELTDKDGIKQVIRQYHFMTDFDLLDESEDGRISPLHLANATGRIFSGRVAVPTLITALIPQGKAPVEQPPKLGEEIPEEILTACRAKYDRTDTTNNAELRYYTDTRSSFVYAAGRITTKDGSADKCFVLYARNAPDDVHTRNRCIVQLPRCIAYYIAEAENIPVQAEPVVPGTEGGTE